MPAHEQPARDGDAIGQMGVDGNANWRPDSGKGNWPEGDWIEYSTVYGNRPYEVLPDSTVDTLPVPELARYVQRRRRFIPRERGVSGSGYAVIPAGGGGPIDIPEEKQFVPFYELEFIYTWFQVPLAAVPWTAIARCIGRVNGVGFDDGALGVFRAAIRRVPWFSRGLVSDVVPYRQPDESWAVDIPYLLRYQPGSGLYDSDYRKNGWNTIPNVSGGWDQVVVRDNPALPLYFTPLDSSGGTYAADFAGLFRPEP